LWSEPCTSLSGKLRSVPLIDEAAKPLDGLRRRGRVTGTEDRVVRQRRWLTCPPMRLHDLRHSFGTLAVQVFPRTDVQAPLASGLPRWFARS
jgi:hypothetical protein